MGSEMCIRDRFTEVGYVGREVDSIIRDLADASIKLFREQEVKRHKNRAEEAAEERILDILLPKPQGMGFVDEEASVTDSDNSTRQKFRKKLREGDLDEKEIEVEVNTAPMGVEIMAPPGMEEMSGQLQDMFSNFGSKKKKTKLKIKDALKRLTEDEAQKLINEDELKQRAIENVEQNGIVFIDEIDKVAKRSDAGGADVSREGVQRDLLPLVEGCTVSTKYGMIKTDHILFIASGAFHLVKPSDLIPELQGRLPIRVELNALTAEDFVRILTEPDASLTEQYIALMKTEGVELSFTKEGIEQIAHAAYDVNQRTENIGARRLHTIMEKLMDEISFEAPDRSGDKIVIDANFVNDNLSELIQDEDLSRYIL